MKKLATTATATTTTATTIATAALSLCLLAATGAQAQAVRSEKNMSLELANQIAAATVASCAANGYAVTATVVDRAATVRAVQRADLGQVSKAQSF